MRTWWAAGRLRTKVILVVVALVLVLAAISQKATVAPALTSSSSPPTPATSSSTFTAPNVASGPSSCHSTNGLPDPACTPGVADPHVTQENIGSTICVSGYTATVRPPATYTNALKIDQMKAYGETNLTPADVEEDHLIALELGGDPRDPKNLWPEPRSGTNPAAVKDALENRLHAEVCAGTMTLAEAQLCISVDWVTCAVTGAAPPVASPPTSSPAAPPVTAPPPAAETVSFTFVSSPVARNANATVRVQTDANANCTIIVRYSSGPSKAQGLEPKTADGAGAAAWTWTVGPNTTRGTWPITVTCGGISASTAFTVQ